MKPLKIDGIIPPLVTPLNGRSGLDRNALERLIEHVIAGGVHGIFLLGSTGEGASLTYELRSRVIHAGVRITAGRVPVFINITSASFLESIQLLELASNEGADFAVMAPPFYYPMNQYELIRYFAEVANSATIPLLLYNAPHYTKSEIEPASFQALLQHERIVGIKDSSGKMNDIRALLNIRKEYDFTILVGPELLLGECLLLGCDGGICGGANLYPGLYVNFFNAVRGYKGDEIPKYQALIEKIHAHIYNVADSPMGIVLGLKTLLSIKGICSHQMAMPVYSNLTEEQKQKMLKVDKEIELYGF